MHKKAEELTWHDGNPPFRLMSGKTGGYNR